MFAIISPVLLFTCNLLLLNIQGGTSQFIDRGIVFPNGRSSEHILSKRDPSFVAADVASEGCVLLNKNYGTNKVNKKIQMAECYLNSRIDHQRFAVFEPDDGNMLASREFGPYGSCYAYTDWPDANLLYKFENKNYACFGWTKKGADRKGKTTAPAFPGTYIIPPPIGCPHNLQGCYSHGVYNPGGRLANLANVRSTFTGLIIGPKDANGKTLWCGACPIGTNLQMQPENIAKLGCDLRKCANYRYAGSTTLMNPATMGKLAQGSSQNPTAGGTAASSPQSKGGTRGGGNSFLTTLMGGGGGAGGAAAGGTPPVTSSTPAAQAPAAAPASGNTFLANLLGGGRGGGAAQPGTGAAAGGANGRSPIFGNLLGGRSEVTRDIKRSKHSKPSAPGTKLRQSDLKGRQRVGSRYRHRRGLRRRF